MKVCIVGLGYMGLPTAFLLAKGGCEVTGYDISKKRIEQLQHGVLPFDEKGLPELYKDAKRNFTPISSLDQAAPDAYIVAVPTPFTEKKECDLSYVKSAVESLVPHLRKGVLVVLESTVSPGTTVKVVKPILESTGLKAGKDFHLAYVSEKAIPGDTLREMVENARIIGAYDKESEKRTIELYSHFVKGKLHTTDCTTAETVKLVENTYRDINIAFANQLADICAQRGMNAWEVISLANNHPRVNVHLPGPGVGGHCIAIDPWFLVEDADSELIRLARTINDARPHLVAEAVERAIKEKGLHKPRIAILGVAYKKDVDDSRESPAIEIIQLLKKAGHDVVAHDPYVQHFEFPLERDLVATLAKSDLIVIVTDHSVYKEKKQQFAGKVVVDTRNVGYEPAYLLGRDF